MKKIADRHLKTLVPLLKEFHNETDDFSNYHFRATLKPYLFSIVLIYSLIMVISCTGNLLMSRHILKTRKRRYKSEKVTFDMLLGNCINDIIVKDMLVMPFSLFILVTVHWTQGAFMCYTFPLIQDACFYATSITYLLIFYNRYKMALHLGIFGSFSEVSDHNFGLPTFWGLATAWLVGFLGVLPYTVYIEFIDLSYYLHVDMEGTGFCVVNLDGNTQEYVRCLFITFYVLPIALVAYFHSRTATLLKTWPANESVRFDNHQRDGDVVDSYCMLDLRTSSTSSVLAEGRPASCRPPLRSKPSLTGLIPTIVTERSSQRILIVMFFVHAFCLLPINVLRMSKHVVMETRENSVTFDVTFVIFVAIEFSSTALNPVLYYLWMLGYGSVLSKDTHQRFFNCPSLQRQPSTAQKRQLIDIGTNNFNQDATIG